MVELKEKCLKKSFEKRKTRSSVSSFDQDVFDYALSVRKFKT